MLFDVMIEQLTHEMKSTYHEGTAQRLCKHPLQTQTIYRPKRYDTTKFRRFDICL